MRTDDYKKSPYNPAVPDGEFGIACDSSLLVHTWCEYAGNRVYEDGVLSRLLFDGGYVSFRDSVPTYHYYIRDHLGNNRVVADAHGNVEEVNHYDPVTGRWNVMDALAEKYYAWSPHVSCGDDPANAIAPNKSRSKTASYNPLFNYWEQSV